MSCSPFPESLTRAADPIAATTWEEGWSRRRKWSDGLRAAGELLGRMPEGAEDRVLLTTSQAAMSGSSIATSEVSAPAVRPRTPAVSA
jgi:hypothetical protein